MVETEGSDADGLEGSTKDSMELDLASQMAEMSLIMPNEVEEEADNKVKKDVLNLKNPVFSKNSASSKVIVFLAFCCYTVHFLSLTQCCRVVS